MEPNRILVIRRDNIGDLVCTTPLITALRRRYPQAHLAALTNSYTLAVLTRNPDLDAVLAYTKFKHRATGESILKWLWQDRLRFLLQLARARFDLVVLAAPVFQAAASRFARTTRARHVLGVTPDGRPGHGINLVPEIPPAARHEVERVFSLLSAIGISGAPPPLTLRASDEALASARTLMAQGGAARVIGIHISARKASQRWPAERFIALLRELRNEENCTFALFWSPGKSDNPLHPGDDDKAARIIDALGVFPVVPVRTATLDELIAGLAVCDRLICSDGGAMHLAAALGKPMVCLFGDSDATRWHPWGVRHQLLQATSRNVTDISVGEVLSGWRRLVAD